MSEQKKPGLTTNPSGGTKWWPNSRYLYFVLAAVDLCAICLFIAYSSTILNTFSETNAINRAGTHQHSLYAELSAAADDCRSPVNQAIETKNAAVSKELFNEAVSNFREQLNAVQVHDSLTSETQKSDFQRRVGHIRDALRRLERDSHEVLRLVDGEQEQQAVALIPAINHSYSEIVEELRQLTRLTQHVLETRLDAQATEVAGLRSWQTCLAFCGLLVVTAVCFYAHRFAEKISNQVDQLAEKEARLATIVDTAADGIVTMNHQGIIENCNTATLKLFAREKSEIVGAPIFMLMEEFDEKAEAAGHMTLCLLDVKSLIGTKRELRGNRPDGSKFYIELAVAAVSFADKRVITGIIHDVTERREFETQLKQHRQAAEAATEAKSQFLANMSHEIRTPMTAIIGYADLLLEPDQSVEERESCVRTVRRNADHLLTLINDILDLSKIDAGKMTVEKIPLSPTQLIDDVATLMKVRATDKQIGFEVIHDSPLPTEIVSDPVRLRQVLINLVGNAIKFTKVGQVRIHSSVKNLDSDKPTICFRVLDSGIGLTPEQVGRLFQPFTQADYSTTRKFGGTGLGLTISKKLVNMMGGDIKVSSVPDLGSCFEFEVPTGSLKNVSLVNSSADADHNKVKASQAKFKAPPKLTARVLLAEDGADNYRLISYHLRKAGATVVHAENGQLAVNFAIEARDNQQPFDVVLMDMQMPVMDGYHATGRLRELGVTTPIIALTANAMSGDREKCLGAGCTDFLTKPINAPLLIRTVHEYATKGATPVETPEAKPQVAEAPVLEQEAPKAPVHLESEVHVQLEVHVQPEVKVESEVPVQSAVSVDQPVENETAETALTDTSATELEPLLSEFADDEDMLEIIEGFLLGIDDRIVAIEAALVTGDLALIASLSHQLKGAAGGYGYPSITDAASDVERLAKAGVLDSSMTSAIQSLTLVCRRAIAGFSTTATTTATETASPSAPMTEVAASSAPSEGAAIDAVIKDLELETQLEDATRELALSTALSNSLTPPVSIDSNSSTQNSPRSTSAVALAE